MPTERDYIKLVGNEVVSVKTPTQTLEVPLNHAVQASNNITPTSLRLPISGYAQTDNNVVFVGDSLTAGYPANYVTGAGTTTGNVYPAIALTQLNASGPNWTGVNLGVPGKYAAMMLTDAPAQATANYLPGKNNVAVIFAGINDLSGMAATDDPNVKGAQVAAIVVNLCNAWRQYVGPDGGGYRVVLVTLAATAYTYKDAARAACNVILRQQYTTCADALADVGADPALGAINASHDPRWFQSDTIHPTLAGYARLGNLVAPFIYAARLGAVFRPQTPPDGVALPRLVGFQGVIGNPNNVPAPGTPVVVSGSSSYVDFPLTNLTNYGGNLYVMEMVGVDFDGSGNVHQRKFLIRMIPGNSGVQADSLQDDVNGGNNPTTWSFAFSPDASALRMTFSVPSGSNLALVRYTVLDRLRTS